MISNKQRKSIRSLDSNAVRREAVRQKRKRMGFSEAGRHKNRGFMTNDR